MRNGKKYLLAIGDFFPTEANYSLFCEGRLEELLDNELIEIFQNAEVSVANLEGSLTDSACPIIKDGPNLKAPRQSINIYTKLNMKCLSMANNHIMDFGYKGFQDTIELLQGAGIKYLGAGNNLKEARRPAIFEISDKKVGLYSCAEYEFTIATEKSPGANPFDSLNILDDIEALKKEVDYLIVFYHGGKEYYRYPAPYVQKRCRRMADKGADLILCQHSHCIGCMEKYQGAVILYGQGDFILNNSDNDYRNTGLIVIVDVDTWEVDFQPVCKNGCGVRLAKNEEKKEILASFFERTHNIENAGFVQAEYKKFANEMLPIYEKWITGFPGKVLYRLCPSVLKKYRNRKNQCQMINLTRCEAHRDLYINGIVYNLMEDNDVNISK